MRVAGGVSGLGFLSVNEFEPIATPTPIAATQAPNRQRPAAILPIRTIASSLLE
jgi:hypothetical protein